MVTGHEPWERRIEPADSALLSFDDALNEELDQQNGAFPWWDGHSNWKTLTMIADYLIQSVRGAREALVAASFAAKTHRESNYAASVAYTNALRARAKSGETTPEAAFAAIYDDDAAIRRERNIVSSAEHCFFHLGQTLDRLSAALIIVGGFGVGDVVSADWGTIVGTPKRPGLVQDLAAPAPRNRVEPPATRGRALQEKLLEPVTRPDDFGPPGWLDWLRDTRNAMTHRSPATKVLFLNGDAKRGLHIVRLFYRQGRWSELQSVIYGRPQHDQTFWGAFITRPSEDILDGLCESVCKLVVDLTGGMRACWDSRKAYPALIVQQGSQWQKIQPTEPISAFDGYGEDVGSLVRQQSIVSDDNFGRWQAAGVFGNDDRYAEWLR
ncbi:hypothetical protein [Mycobacterium sp. E2699]|uniref:hypothetical protein n=1 Tax=Mycobacterium sp. E2699 TaxID=1834137 RepID=UPI0012E9D3A1|nr:hypothetical protein [Mycobacterium sp. E2699]